MAINSTTVYYPPKDTWQRMAPEQAGFDPPHNDNITWHMLFQQTSEWSGEL